MAYAVATSDSSAVLQHPHMRVVLSHCIAPASVSSDGTVSEAQWGSEYSSDSLSPQQMNWASNGELSTLTFKCELGAGGTEVQKHAEDLDVHIEAGTRVRLVDSHTGVEWFAGLVALDSMLIQASPQAEDYSVTAYGPELRLKNKAVPGQWFANPVADRLILAGTATASDLTRDNVYQTDIPAVFNKDGKPNCMSGSGYEAIRWQLATNMNIEPFGSAVFTSPDRSVRVSGGGIMTSPVRWTAYTALRSLLEWIDDYDVNSPTYWAAIKPLLNPLELGEVDVDGMDLLQAIHAVLSSVGYGFCWEPWSFWSELKPGETSHGHDLLVYNLKNPASDKHPYLPAAGTKITDAAGKKGEVQRLHFVRDNHGAKNHITVLGDAKRVQVSLTYQATKTAATLWPRWDKDVEEAFVKTQDLATYVDADNKFDAKQTDATKDATLKARYCPDGDEYQTYQHVWRSFCWNEDGRFSQFKNNGATPPIPYIPDVFTQCDIGDSVENYARRPRPIGPTLVYTDATFTDVRNAQVILTAGGESVDITGQTYIWSHCAGITIRGTASAAQKDDMKNTVPGVPDSLFDYSMGQTWYWCPFLKSLTASQALKGTSYLTLLHNTIRNAGTTMTITVTGTIEDDEHLKAISPKQAGSSWPLVSRKIVRVPAFKEYRVKDSIGGTTYVPDDSEPVATTYARRVRDAAEDELGHGSITIPFLTRAYAPGVGISRTAGRRVALHVDGGDRNYSPVVRAVSFQLGEPPSTEILLDSPLLGVST